MDAEPEADVVRGTPQGAPISPLLANVYLHNVLDEWFAREWRPREVRGEAYIVRYADDFVLGFQHRDDAVRFMEALRERFAAYGLELHPEKTRLVEFGRLAEANRRERGERRPETFDFLGFTHYCRTTRKGRFGLGRKPAPKRMRRTLKAIKAELRRRMHDKPVKTGQWLGRVLRGWVAWLLRGSHKLPLATAVRERLEAAVAVCPPPEVAARPFHMGASRCIGTRPLAPCFHPPPVADGAICRQNSRQEPDALTGTSGSVRGVPGNRHPSWDRTGRPEVLGDSVRTTSREALCVPEASRSLAVDRAPAGSSGRATH